MMSASQALEAALVAAVDELIATRGLAGAQVSVRVGAEVRVDVARGVCGAGAPLRVTARFPAFCLTKLLTAWAVLETCAAQALELEAHAADVLPEFGRNGKRAVRLRHLLTNCAGIDESVVWPVRITFGATAAEVYDAVCWSPLRPDWDPERRAYYDYTNAYTVLGVWLERVRGCSFRAIVDELAGRLGIAPGLMPAPLDGASPWAARDWTPQVRLGTAAVERDALAMALSGSPASGLVASAAELCTLWAALAEGGAIPPALAGRMRTPQRSRRFDEQLRRECDYGLGVMTSLADYHSWGLPAEFTARSFGHIGLGVALAAVVPERRLVYAVLLNGLEYPKTENFRMQRVLASTVCAHAPLLPEASAALAPA